MDTTLLYINQISLFYKYNFEIGADVAQLLASGRLFEPSDKPRYHHHDLHVAVSRTLNTIICLLTLFDIEISSLTKQKYIKFNKK